MNKYFSTLIALCLCISQLSGQSKLPELKVSDDSHYLVQADGKPFFWLGDTAWELFHKLDRDEAETYLRNRAENGFTVIQAVAIAELDGHIVPNPYGHLPFINLDPTKPSTKDAANNDDYWDHVDYIVNRANELGMYVGFLPTWGKYWHDNIRENGNKPLFTPQNAEQYGEFLGKRYKDKGIIWILGGDRKIENAYQLDIIRAMAKGLKKGDQSHHLITFHPQGGTGSADFLHNEPWLDFNMRQNGHKVEYVGRYDKTIVDYRRIPTKPVIDGEPIYEDHPIAFEPSQLGYTVAADIRRPLYWDLFDGAFGHTYGHHSVWQMFDPAKDSSGKNGPLLPWHEAINRPGAKQMKYAKSLIESRPFLDRIPDPNIIVKGDNKAVIPGAGRYHFSATRDKKGTYIMVYAPVGRAFSVNTDIIDSDRINAWWYNPRNGEVTRIGQIDNRGVQEFTPPSIGEIEDWVLVLDDASQKYPEPGSKK